MNKTVLITGCSTGIGRAVAIRFQGMGWNVAATMRRPDIEAALAELPNTTVFALDVESRESIQRGVDETIRQFGSIDVVINNAGFGLFGLFEEAGEEDIDRQIAVNLMGPVHVMRAVLPHFRARRAGLFVNVTSLAAGVGVPLNTYYCASKWGLEGLTEGLAAELKTYGIRFKIVRPGFAPTAFHGKYNQQVIQHIDDYDGFREAMNKKISPDPNAMAASSVEYIAKKVVQAALDPSTRLRYAAGRDVLFLQRLRKLLPESLFLKLVSTQFSVN